MKGKSVWNQFCLKHYWIEAMALWHSDCASWQTSVLGGWLMKQPCFLLQLRFSPSNCKFYTLDTQSRARTCIVQHTVVYSLHSSCLLTRFQWNIVSPLTQKQIYKGTRDGWEVSYHCGTLWSMMLCIQPDLIRSFTQLSYRVEIRKLCAIWDNVELHRRLVGPLCVI